MKRQFQSHGSGKYERDQFRALGENVTLEEGILVFHPQNISLGSNVYVGHQTILKGYHLNEMKIGSNCWIGQQCFFHSAGGITIEDNVGIGPGVKIITSEHDEEGIETPILFSKLSFGAVTIKEDSDIGIGSIILPGVCIGKGVQIGAGSVVTKNIPDYSVAVGVPAKVIKTRRRASELKEIA